MSKIIECVPNFSEGRDKKVDISKYFIRRNVDIIGKLYLVHTVRQIIDAISDAVRATAGAVLLDVDPGASTNRTVYTFVGDPASVVQAALNAAKVAFTLIDMRKHTGEHPRQDTHTDMYRYPHRYV